MKTRLRFFVLGLALTGLVGGLLLTSLPRPTARAQQGDTPAPDAQLVPFVMQAERFAVTAPLRNMEPSSEPTESFRFGRDEENAERPEKKLEKTLSGREDTVDGALSAPPQSAEVQANAVPAPSVNFEGLSNQNNATVYGGTVNPPDTVGDVGPTQYLQAVNLLLRVYDKTGVPQTPPLKVSSVFSALGGRCATRDDGDPIVLYDSLADRWVITQFLAGGGAPFGRCFAVSRTGDAAGAYYVYDFPYPEAINFNDYDKFGVWPDAYYGSANEFNASGTAFLTAGVFALDREKMLRGDPSATQIYFNLRTLAPNASALLPSDADGLRPPPAGAPNIYSFLEANEFAGEVDGLRLFEFHADFANPSASTFTERADSPLLVAAFDGRNPAGRDDIEQPSPAPPTAYLDSIGGQLMHRLQYRNFGSYEALVVTHTVNVSGVTPNSAANYRAAPRYHEIRRDSPTGNFYVREESTFVPDLDERWMGSAAMDNQGNIALGYSVSSTTTHPSIRYAGRLVDDPPGLAQGETTVIAGTGVQTNNNSRWGDYSSMNVDPTDDCTFYYTNEYYRFTDRTPATFPFGTNWQTRVAGFKFPQCTPPARGTLQITVTDCATGQPVAGASVRIDDTLFGTTLADGTLSAQLPPGTYTVTVSAPNGFTSGAAQTVTVSDNGTAQVAVCVTPNPVIVNGGATLGAESCSPDNNLLDPGETVSVDLTVRNAGSASTTNLVGTLLPSATVINPSGPQNYGAIPPSGTATRTFTFTAGGNCGDTITLTLQLNDNGVDLGTVTYTFTLGQLITSPAYSENFDGVIAPALPPGWTTFAVAAAPPPAPQPSPWRTISSPAAFVNTPPNSAATDDYPFTSATLLVSPSIAIPASSGTGSGAQMTFGNFYNTEAGFDGGVLEISVNGGAFQDIIAGGGSFVAGGYNDTISPIDGSSIAGRQAWSGNSGGFITTTVNLPASAVGQSVRFRWLAVFDGGVEVANGGWRIDTISISSTTRVCTATCTSNAVGAESKAPARRTPAGRLQRPRRLAAMQWPQSLWQGDDGAAAVTTDFIALVSGRQESTGGAMLAQFKREIAAGTSSAAIVYRPSMGAEMMGGGSVSHIRRIVRQR